MIQDKLPYVIQVIAKSARFVCPVVLWPITGHEPAHCYVLIAENRNFEIFFRLRQMKTPMPEGEILFKQDTRSGVPIAVNLNP